MGEEKAFQTLETASIKASDCQVLREFERVGGLRAKGLQEAQEEVGARVGQIVDSFDHEARKCALSPEGNRSH